MGNWQLKSLFGFADTLYSFFFNSFIFDKYYIRFVYWYKNFAQFQIKRQKRNAHIRHIQYKLSDIRRRTFIIEWFGACYELGNEKNSSTTHIYICMISVAFWCGWLQTNMPHVQLYNMCLWVVIKCDGISFSTAIFAVGYVCWHLWPCSFFIIFATLFYFRTHPQHRRWKFFIYWLYGMVEFEIIFKRNLLLSPVLYVFSPSFSFSTHLISHHQFVRSKGQITSK